MWDSLIGLVAELLKVLYNITYNYGLAIILLTIIIRVILYPLMQKQMVSMREMQKIQPLMKEVQEKYKKDKERLNKELMALYKEHRVNPMSGCLPLLIQMPILILLFQVLRVFEYKDKLDNIVGGFLWIPHQVEIIKDGLPTVVGGLAAPEQLIQLPFKIFGLQSIGIMPFLVGASMFYQQKMTTTPTTTSKEGGSAEQTQKMMLIMMPLLIAFMSFSLPSGLTLYWLVSTLLGIGQQYLINKKMPAEAVDLKSAAPKKEEKTIREKTERPVSLHQEEDPWIPGYRKEAAKNPFRGKKRGKNIKKIKRK